MLDCIYISVFSAVKKPKRPREEAEDEFKRYFGMELKKIKKFKCTCKFCGEKGKVQPVVGYTKHLQRMYNPEQGRRRLVYAFKCHSYLINLVSSMAFLLMLSPYFLRNIC